MGVARSKLWAPVSITFNVLPSTTHLRLVRMVTPEQLVCQGSSAHDNLGLQFPNANLLEVKQKNKDGV